MTAPSSRTMLVLLPVQWRKALERLGCLLNQEGNSAGGSWMLCECSVWSNVKLRLEVSAAGLASPGSSSFLGRAHRALCSWALGSVAPSWVQALSASSWLLCAPCAAAVEPGSSGRGVCEASQPWVRAAAPSALMGL